MTTPDRRLANIKSRLTPKQCVMAYLDEIMRQFDSFGDWSRWQADAPTAEAPLVKPTKAAVEAAVKGIPAKAAATARNDAAMETVFLMTLFLNTATKLAEDLDTYKLLAVRCAREIQLLLLEHAFGDDATRAIDAPDGIGGPVGGVNMDGYIDRMLEAHTGLCGFAGRVYLHRDTIEVICKNYFDGRPILFPDMARHLANMIATAETLSDEFNDMVRSCLRRFQGAGGGNTGWPRPGAGLLDKLTIDLPALRRTARTSIRKEAAYTVRMAKGEAMSKMGMHEEGHAMIVAAYKTRFGDGWHGAP